jgi:hypothetical protein
MYSFVSSTLSHFQPSAGGVSSQTPVVSAATAVAAAYSLPGLPSRVPIEVAIERSAPLSKEIEEGNVEYKLHLLDPNPERLRGLVTQLMWRCREGAGSCVYNIGVR